MIRKHKLFWLAILATFTFLLGACGDVEDIKAALSAEDQEKVDENLEEVDQADREKVEAMSDSCKLLYVEAKIIHDEARVDSNLTQEEKDAIMDANAAFLDQCKDEAPEDLGLFIPRDPKEDSPEDDPFMIPDYCEVLVHEAEMGDEQAAQEFADGCLSDAQEDFRPDNLDETCNALYDDAYDVMKSVFTNNCAQYFEMPEGATEECMTKMMGIEGSTKAFYEDCGQLVNGGPVFPWEDDGEGSHDGPGGDPSGEGDFLEVPYEELSPLCQEKYDGLYSMEPTKDDRQAFVDACWDEAMPVIPPHVDDGMVPENCEAAYLDIQQSMATMFVMAGECQETMEFLGSGSEGDIPGSQECVSAAEQMMAGFGGVMDDCPEEYQSFGDPSGDPNGDPMEPPMEYQEGDSTMYNDPVYEEPMM